MNIPLNTIVRTGISELDNKCKFNNGELIIIAGRPSMGKTTLGQNILTDIAKNKEGQAVFFSLEMPKQSVIKRLISNIASIPMACVYGNKPLTKGGFEKLSYHSEKIKNLAMIIYDNPRLTARKMRRKLKKIHQERSGISAVLVDYIQLLEVGGDRKEIDEISQELKKIAKEFDCPVFAVSQVSRNVERRPNKRPTIADLPFNGSIEQDADHIIFIYRDEVYRKDSPNKGLAEVIIGKQRNGLEGEFMLRFNGEYNRFEDLAGYQGACVMEKTA